MRRRAARTSDGPTGDGGRADDADRGRRHPPDLRLAAPALAAWAVVLGGIVGGPTWALLLTVLAAGAVGWSARRGGATVLRAVAGCALAAGLVASAHVWLADRHPLRAAAERGAAATVRVELRDDPHPIRGQAYGSRPGAATQVLVASVLRQAEVGGTTWTTGGRLLLIAPTAGWDRLLPGQVVTAEGLLAPAGRRDLTAAVLRVRGPPQQVTEPPWWQTAAGGLRTGLRDAAAAALEPAEAGLLPGLAVGDTSRLTAETEADFRVAGLTHLLAVSGANLAILSGAVLGLLRVLRADPRLAALLGFLAMVGFVVLARPSPSVVRAAVMGAVVLLALAAGRGRSAMPALAAAVLVLLVVDPALAVDPGFALSVSATGALVLLAPVWSEGLRDRGVPGWLAEALTVPAAAFLVTAPLVAGLSGQLSLVTVLANLLAVPAVAPATVLGVLTAVLSALGPPLGPAAAAACAWLAGPAVSWLVVVGDRSAAVPGAALPWPGGVVGGVLLAAIVLALVVLGRSPRWRAVLAALLLGVALVWVPTRVLPPGWPPVGWAVVACDVGQGDAIVLATGEPGWAVLVDAGPEDGPVDGCLDRLGVRGLALVVVSHLHADHIGGLGGALRGRAVSGLAVGPSSGPSQELPDGPVSGPGNSLVSDPVGGPAGGSDWAWRDVARRAETAGAPLVRLRAGHRLRWPALTIDVLGPRHPVHADPDDGTAVNDGSLVLRATTQAGTVLLTGDVELAGQAELLASGVSLRADILKIPHHGSRDTAPAFLAAVAPRAVLVSVGAGNRYRHPDAALLGRLEAGGAVIRRTDQAGDLAVVAGPDEPADPEPADPEPSAPEPSDPDERAGPVEPAGPAEPAGPGELAGPGERAGPVGASGRELVLVSRGQPRPAPRRRAGPPTPPRRDARARPGTRAVFSPGRPRPAPRAPPWWSRAPWPSGRPAPPRRRASSDRRR